ncbi:hypothetical protein ACRE_068650 [Hapsidospora chrysogenum ATCC 11550]|uniref:Uncharacterized protein n=1 Tax=Hapsidospora chrysogenum (strain ATCC 11550 / CBS 779.69 / DSM 880 / IAM 14645 / JCM 23072 / IMI 49137) TaxID=857340 RepID=A0A086SZ90_HAPC1|nr:hypothetical protein ACRE_068650 [Hapsidospora chrysogenum ATCC 11550]
MAMQRPRNRQPRPPRQQQSNSRPPRHNSRPNQGQPVPTVQQVVPGAGVSIVLKEDQPTGRETPGTVQDILTKGNHPRGIKVRLRGGQVGRVQRMLAQSTGEAQSEASNATTSAARPTTTAPARFTHRYTDVRLEEDDFPEGPPPRSLADFFPSDPASTAGPGPGPDASADESAAQSPKATARCPICDAFEGDEVAVSYHVEREHLT